MQSQRYACEWNLRDPPQSLVVSIKESRPGLTDLALEYINSAGKEARRLS